MIAFFSFLFSDESDAKIGEDAEFAEDFAPTPAPAANGTQTAQSTPQTEEKTTSEN